MAAGCHRVGGWLALLLWLVLFTAQAEPRFPPPDFQSGYEIPPLEHPAVRALWQQYLDVGLLIAALGLASYLVLKRRSRKAVVGLSLFSLVYFGFYREGCICAIGSIQNVALALFDASYQLPLITLLFFVAPLVTALFFGRSFCAAVCPHGALQDLVLVKPVSLPRWLEQGLGILPFVYLGAGVLFAATGSAFVICRLDPFVPLFRLSGSYTMMLVGIALVLVGLFIGRPYCRFFCPYGALLRMASSVSRWFVRVTPDTCTQCRLCENACPYGVIRVPTTTPVPPAERGHERRRFLRLGLALPLIVGLAAWVGVQFGGAASRLNPKVSLAELQLVQQSDLPRTNLTTVEALALSRANQSATTLLPEAVGVRRDFRLGGALFGGWVGLVVGLRLLGFSFWRRQTDYEPDRGGCFGCARCFRSCPQELVRLGLASAVQFPPANIPSPGPARPLAGAGSTLPGTSGGSPP